LIVDLVNLDEHMEASQPELIGTAGERRESP
jgi:hypothetical protein